jgi:hypothetical protein
LRVAERKNGKLKTDKDLEGSLYPFSVFRFLPATRNPLPSGMGSTFTFAMARAD